MTREPSGRTVSGASCGEAGALELLILYLPRLESYLSFSAVPELIGTFSLDFASAFAFLQSPVCVRGRCLPLQAGQYRDVG